MPDVYDRVDAGGLKFDYVAGKERLRDALLHAFPREQAAIDGYFTAIRRCLKTLGDRTPPARTRSRAA